LATFSRAPESLNRLQVGADRVPCQLGLNEPLIAFSNQNGRGVRRWGKTCLALVERRLGDLTGRLVGGIEWPLSVGWHERIEPRDRGEAIAAAMLDACPNTAKSEDAEIKASPSRAA